MSAAALTGARVLVVDDVPANLGALGEFLEAAGAQVFIAQSGAAALARLAAVAPDVILLDVMMPGLDGVEVCRRLKADARWREVPVLFITALGETVDKVAGFAAGGVDYIVKPFQPEEVLARVAAHVQIARLRRELGAQAQAVQAKNDELEREMQRRIATERAMQRLLDRAVVVTDLRGEVRFCSDRAARLLERFFPGWTGARLPETLLAEAGMRGLRVRHSSGADAGERLWLLEETPAEPVPAMLEKLGLTPREAEILFWIAQGKTNGEIGVILGMADNTVKKHVYNLLPKLGLETRIAAALRAMEVLGIGGAGET